MRKQEPKPDRGPTIPISNFSARSKKLTGKGHRERSTGYWWWGLILVTLFLGSCSSHVDKGDDLMEKKDYYHAIGEYRLAVSQNEKNPEARAKLGIAYHRVGQLKQAEQELRQAVELAPREAEYQVAFADVLYDSNRLAEARAHYGTAVNHGEDTAHVRTRIAEAEVANGNLPAASRHLQIALTKDPNSVEANKGMGDLLNEANAYGQAEKYYLRALDVDPENTEVRNNLGLVYRKWERFDDAIETFKSVLEDEPNNEDSLRYLANLHFDRGEYALAEQYFKRILEINPEDGNAQLGKNYIQSLRDQGELD